MPLPPSTILFVEPKNGNHCGVLSAVNQTIVKEFRSRHWEVSVVSPDSSDFLPKLIRFGAKPDAIIHFGAFFYDLRFSAQNHFKEQNLIDLFRCRTVCLFGDHPLTAFMWERVQNMSPRTLAVSSVPSFFDEARLLNRELHQFLRTNPSIYYARKNQVVPFEERPIDVLIPLSFDQQPDFFEILQNNFTVGSQPHAFVSALYDSLLSNRTDTLLQIALPLIREIFGQNLSHVSPDNPFAVKVASVISAVDLFVRQQRRCDMLDGLLRDTRGLNVVLVDRGAPTRFKSSDIRCVPSMNASELGELMGKSKSIVHVHPTYPDGLHERIINGMANGCALISDYVPALASQFEQNKEWICATQGDSLNGVLENGLKEKRGEIAARACEKTWAQYSIEQYVSNLLEGLNSPS